MEAGKLSIEINSNWSFNSSRLVKIPFLLDHVIAVGAVHENKDGQQNHEPIIEPVGHFRRLARIPEAVVVLIEPGRLQDFLSFGVHRVLPDVGKDVVPVQVSSFRVRRGRPTREWPRFPGAL